MVSLNLTIRLVSLGEKVFIVVDLKTLNTRLNNFFNAASLKSIPQPN
jgi:hypothetical protein